MKQSENQTMMSLVVGTESMFFVCLILSFVYMAFHSGFEPHELGRLDIRTTGIFTVFLIASSFTLLLAEKGYRKGKTNSMKGWLCLTLILGAIFLIGQGQEYLRLIRENVTLGGSVFGTSFYTLTGFHALHVFIGLVVLSIILSLAFLGDYDKPEPGTALSAAAMYWHFVDIVWIVVFTVVYVLPKFTRI